jgi:hypothetical protein
MRAQPTRAILVALIFVAMSSAASGSESPARQSRQAVLAHSSRVQTAGPQSAIPWLAHGAGTVLTTTPSLDATSGEVVVGDCAPLSQPGEPDGRCELTQDIGSSVTAVAVPDPGYSFRYWTRSDCPEGPVCDITLETSVEPIGAVFSGVRLRVAPESLRQVPAAASNPEGIKCPNKCRADFPQGTTVTLTADAPTFNPDSSPDPFSTWWPEGVCEPATISTCTIRLTQDLALGFRYQTPPPSRPVFALIPTWSLRISVGGAGSGRVTITGALTEESPSSCSSSCSVTSRSQVIALRAESVAGSQPSWLMPGGNFPCAGASCQIDLADGINGVSACFSAARNNPFRASSQPIVGGGGRSIRLRVSRGPRDRFIRIAVFRHEVRIAGWQTSPLSPGMNDVTVRLPSGTGPGNVTIRTRMLDAPKCISARGSQRLHLG